MKLDVFIVVSQKGAVRVTKTRPSLAMNEIAIGTKLIVPDGMFHRPQLVATLEISEDAAQPLVISAETKATVRQAIEQSTGLKVELSVAEAPIE